ncbi:MAG TPA: hypothetical protein VF746_15185 [Longimicrobium sp.]|jgi:hypothetical protein
MLTRSSSRRLQIAITGAVFLACTVASPAHAQPLAREVARFAERLNEEPENELGEGPARPTPATWDALDAIVLAALGGGVAPHRLDSLLATLPGYHPPSEGAGFQLGRTTFYSSLPQETPNYFVAPVRVGGRTLLLGLYSLTYNGTGRMSVYARTGGRWRRTARVDARNPLTAHLLPLGDTVLGLVTVETFVGADRQEGRIELWRLTPGGLRLQHAERGRFVDYDVQATRSAVAVQYDSFPKHLAAPVLGPRLSFRTTYRARGGRFVADTVSLAPWVEVLESFYRLAPRGPRSLARSLVAGENEGLYRLLARAREVDALDAGGDLARGEGWVLLSSDRGVLRVVSRRGPGGRWRIVYARPARRPN